MLSYHQRHKQPRYVLILVYLIKSKIEIPHTMKWVLQKFLSISGFGAWPGCTVGGESFHTPKVVGSIPSHSTRGGQLIYVSLSHECDVPSLLSLSFSLSLLPLSKINKTYPLVRIKNKCIWKGILRDLSSIKSHLRIILAANGHLSKILPLLHFFFFLERKLLFSTT